MLVVIEQRIWMMSTWKFKIVDSGKPRWLISVEESASRKQLRLKLKKSAAQ